MVTTKPPESTRPACPSCWSMPIVDFAPPSAWTAGARSHVPSAPDGDTTPLSITMIAASQPAPTARVERTPGTSGRWNISAAQPNRQPAGDTTRFYGTDEHELQQHGTRAHLPPWRLVSAWDRSRLGRRAAPSQFAPPSFEPSPTRTPRLGKGCEYPRTPRASTTLGFELGTGDGEGQRGDDDDGQDRNRGLPDDDD